MNSPLSRDSVSAIDDIFSRTFAQLSHSPLYDSLIKNQALYRFRTEWRSLVNGPLRISFVWEIPVT